MGGKMEWKPTYWNHVAGVLYGVGLWVWIDSIVYTKNPGTISETDAVGNTTVRDRAVSDAIQNPAFYLPIILSTIMLIIVNTVSHRKISGEVEEQQCAARTLVTATYVVLFGSLAATIWITAKHDGADDDEGWWPFIANITAIFLITV